MGDATNAAWINAASQSASTAANVWAVNTTNKKSRQFNEKMAQQQRQWALDDWKMNNEYNRPSAQMARLREAGLNPNLVYGKGADNTSAPVRSTDAATWNPTPPDFSGFAKANPLASMYDFKRKQAEIDLLRNQNTIALQDAALKEAQTLYTLGQTNQLNLTGEYTKAGTAKLSEETKLIGQQLQNSMFDLAQKQSLAPYQLDAAREGVRKTQADIKYTIDENERRTLLNANNIAEGMSRILLNRANTVLSNSNVNRNASQISNDRVMAQYYLYQMRDVEANTKLKNLEIDLNEGGISKNDALPWRVVGRAMENIRSGFKDFKRRYESDSSFRKQVDQRTKDAYKKINWGEF